MTLTIGFSDETNKITTEQQEMFEGVLQLAADHLELSRETEVSLTIVDDERIHVINREYRQVDRPTDVISFAINDVTDEEEGILEWPEDMPYELGDLFISLDTAERQSEEYGHSLERELGFLAVHGFLHLNGFDHQTVEDEKRMFGLQDEILDDYGLTREK